MDPKARPNHSVYVDVLRRMTPEQRLMKAFELTKMARTLFLDGLRATYPDLPEEKLQKLYKERLALCHNRNW